MIFDKEKVIHAARHGVPLVIKTHTLPPETEVKLEEILTIYLKEIGQLELKDYLSYCLRELTVNSKKANTKRVFFQEKGLNLADPLDYEKGIKTFKQETLDNINYYLDLQRKKDLYIKTTFLIRNQTLFLMVKNNTPIVPKELMRVYDRITRSRAFDSIEEAFSEVLDDSEGAGLGIVIMILMLRKMNLSEKAFSLTSNAQETTATLTIPINSLRLEHNNFLSDEIVQTIDSLPPFPSNLQKMIQLLQDPEVKLNNLAQTLALDPGITSNVIRYVNSAQFSLHRKIASISEAVHVIGIQGIKDLIYSYGAHKVLEKYLVSSQQQLWQNALIASFYAVQLAKKLRLSAENQAHAQTGGLLHNIGQILLSLFNPQISKRIQEFCQMKNTPVDAIEELTTSLNSYDIGARIVQKWNFPSMLVQLISHYNHPQKVSLDLRPIAYTIYLAVNLLAVEQNLMHYSQLSYNILQVFDLGEPEILKEYHEQLKQFFGDFIKN